MNKRVAVILMNLGGPQSIKDIRPFLFNLFYDKTIINLSKPLRWALAKTISVARNRKAKELYKKIGGCSPIRRETEDQARALEVILNTRSDKEYKVFVSMRYWHPFSREAINDIQIFLPEEIVLLPLYPQFSTVTNQSSIKDFLINLEKGSLRNIKPHVIRKFFDNELFVRAHNKLINEAIKNSHKKTQDLVVLFVAHGLPVSVIKKGDPYQDQVEKTVSLIKKGLPHVETSLAYQSKVGPMKWLGPSIKEEIFKISKKKKAIILVSIAFVSEHLETLVELDIELKDWANKCGIDWFYRVRAMGVEKLFIDSLADLCLNLDHAKIRS